MGGTIVPKVYGTPDIMPTWYDRAINCQRWTHYLGGYFWEFTPPLQYCRDDKIILWPTTYAPYVWAYRLTYKMLTRDLITVANLVHITSTHPSYILYSSTWPIWHTFSILDHILGLYAFPYPLGNILEKLSLLPIGLLVKYVAQRNVIHDPLQFGDNKYRDHTKLNLQWRAFYIPRTNLWRRFHNKL